MSLNAYNSVKNPGMWLKFEYLVEALLGNLLVQSFASVIFTYAVTLFASLYVDN